MLINCLRVVFLIIVQWNHLKRYLCKITSFLSSGKLNYDKDSFLYTNCTYEDVDLKNNNNKKHTSFPPPLTLQFQKGGKYKEGRLSSPSTVCFSDRERITAILSFLFYSTFAPLFFFLKRSFQQCFPLGFSYEEPAEQPTEILDLATTQWLSSQFRLG